MGSFLLSVGLLFAGGGDLAVGEGDDPLHIVGGQEANACEWPSVVSILEADETPVMCTGTLVHPDVVTTAAHCIDPERPVVAVGFGEEGQGDVGPQRSVGVVECVGHPQYYQQGYPDIAYCTLVESVTDVPIVPLLAGCEADLLTEGDEVTIVGFGASYGTYNDKTGEVEATGVGPKRWITQTLDSVEPEFDEVHMVGGNGSQSACFGDSGGPALVELPDGTWRVFGAASRLYNPGGFPPPQEEGNVCGTGVTYGFLSTQIEWLESETATDLTPCYADDGSWSPSAGCGAFPVAPGVGAGSWPNGCSGGPVAGGGMQCEDVIDPSTGSSSGGDDSFGSSGDYTSGTSGFPPMSSTSVGTTMTTTASGTAGPVTTGSSTTSTSTSGPSDPSAGDDDDTGSGGVDGETDGDTDTETDGAGQDDLTGRGCTCDAQSSQTGPGSLGAGLLLLGLFSLRRRSSR